MRISLVQISLLRFFKTFHKYLTNANFGLFISLVRFLGKIFGWIRKSIKAKGGLIGWFKSPVSSQTHKLMAATKFSD